MLYSKPAFMDLSSSGALLFLSMPAGSIVLQGPAQGSTLLIPFLVLCADDSGSPTLSPDFHGCLEVNLCTHIV